jgi:hypothetical protein
VDDPATVDVPHGADDLDEVELDLNLSQDLPAFEELVEGLNVTGGTLLEQSSSRM